DDIFSDRGVVPNRALKNERDKAPHLFDRDVPKIETIELDPAALRIVEAAEKLDQSALPGAIGSYNGCDLSRRHVEVEIVEKSRPARVAKVDMTEADARTDTARRRTRTRWIHHSRLQRKELDEVMQKERVAIHLPEV